MSQIRQQDPRFQDAPSGDPRRQGSLPGSGHDRLTGRQGAAGESWQEGGTGSDDAETRERAALFAGKLQAAARGDEAETGPQPWQGQAGERAGAETGAAAGGSPGPDSEAFAAAEGPGQPDAGEPGMAAQLLATSERPATGLPAPAGATPPPGQPQAPLVEARISAIQRLVVEAIRGEIRHLTGQGVRLRLDLAGQVDGLSGLEIRLDRHAMDVVLLAPGGVLPPGLAEAAAELADRLRYRCDRATVRVSVAATPAPRRRPGEEDAANPDEPGAERA